MHCIAREFSLHTAKLHVSLNYTHVIIVKNSSRHTGKSCVTIRYDTVDLRALKS